MPTNEERREVARRLRQAWANVPDANPIRHHLRVLCAIYEAVGFSDVESDAIDLFDRLADLIEPSCDRRAERMCRNLNPPSCRDFECSECGESSEFTPGFMPNYCPHCGARVEEASDDADR